MHLPSFFIFLVYLAAYLILLFAAICLACGLYYLVELAEEYTTLTKKTIRVTIYIQLSIHMLLLIYERFSFFPCFIGFSSHLMYYQLLKSFPFIVPTSPKFILSVIAFLFDNVVWYRWFQSDVELFYRYSIAPVPATAAFFLLVIWLVPTAFFCSLTINDAVLPGAGGPTGFNQNIPDQRNSNGVKRKRRNAVMTGLDSISATVRNFLGGNSRDNDIFS